MANIEGKNFTDFRNINLRGDSYVGGTPGGSTGGALRFASGPAFGGLSGGVSGWDTTVSVVPFSGSTVGSGNGSIENPYLHIANTGLSVGTGFIRFVPFGGSNAGTLSVNTSYNDTDRAWTLPSKSGTFGITGTFSVDLPVVASAGYLSTVVTVTGIRSEDGVVITPMDNGAAGAIISARGVVVPANVVPGNGNITINFVNVFATATIARTGIFGYTAVR